MTQYQVIGECAHVVTADHTGVQAMRLLYKGAFVPEDATDERIEHLLSAGLIAEVGEVPLAPNASVEQTQAPAGDGVHPVVTEADRQMQRAKTDAAADVEAKRAAAKAKLPDDGSPPHGNASKDVWVEYAVTQGMDRAAAESADLKDLRDALKQ